MLDPDFLNDLSSKLKIDKERIAREFSAKRSLRDTKS